LDISYAQSNSGKTSRQMQGEFEWACNQLVAKGDDNPAIAWTKRRMISEHVSITCLEAVDPLAR